MRVSTLPIGAAILLCSCGSSNFSGPQHDEAGVTLQDRISIAFPSKPEVGRSVEGDGLVWSGDGWQVRYGLVDLAQHADGVFSDTKVDCESMKWDGSQKTVVFYHGSPARIDGSGRVRPYLEAQASRIRTH